jgi:uncharacterized membrane protein HdeD (DUF308 family)
MVTTKKSQKVEERTSTLDPTNYSKPTKEAVASKPPIEALSKQPHFLRSVLLGIIIAIIVGMIGDASLAILLILVIGLFIILGLAQKGIKDNQDNTMYQLFIMALMPLMGIIAGLILLFIIDGRRKVFDWTLPIIFLYLAICFAIGYYSG